MSENRLSISESHILDVCCQIEETCAAIYRYFFKLHESNPQASTLWEKTAKEEDNHAEQFRLASRLKVSGIKSLKTDLYNANAILAKMQSVLENVHKSPPPFKEALRFSVSMEHSLAKYHMDSIATFEDPGLAKLFTSMMKADQEHIRMLETQYKALCDESHQG